MTEADKKLKLKRVIGRVLATALILAGVALLFYPTLTDLYTNFLQGRQRQAAKAAFAEKKELPGDAVTILEIPRLKLETVVYEGVEPEDLRRGPGHYPQTALPGQPGNCVIVGHRNVYGSVFKDLDKLQYDDPFYLYGKDGKFVYRVNKIKVVEPTEVQVLLPTEIPTATLLTCHPYYKPDKRLIVSGALTNILSYEDEVAENEKKAS
ncbi:MAG: class E sortase [Bacillota bacterium]|jgi:sortase A|nr:class E sortase [Bacillota bacterium]